MRKSWAWRHAFGAEWRKKNTSLAGNDGPITVLFIGSSTPDRYFTEFTGPSNPNVTKSTNGTTFTPVGTTGAGAAVFGNELNLRTGRPVRLLDAGVSGSRLSEWSDSNTYSNPAIAMALAAGGVDAIVSSVGFNDANGSVVTSLSDHIDKYRALLTKLRAALGSNVPIFIGGSQRYTGPNATTVEQESQFTWVRVAETIVADETNNRWFAHSYDLAQQSDGIHQAQASYPIHATRGAVNVAAYFGAGVQERGPTPVSAARVSDTQTDVTLSHSTGTDFTPTSSISAFGVSTDGFNTLLSISAAVRQSATVIRLTHASTAGAAYAVRALFGVAPSITGLVKDNSARTLPLNPTRSNLLVDGTTTPPAPSPTVSKIDFSDQGATTAPTYNQWVGPRETTAGPADLPSPIALLDTAGTATGWTATLIVSAQGRSNTGRVTGANSGAAPDNVLRTFWFNGDTSSLGAPRVPTSRFKLSGMVPGRAVTLRFLGSRDTTTARSTTYAITDSAGAVLTSGVQANNQNTSTTTTLNGTVDTNGEVYFSFTPAGTAAYGYLNELVITQAPAA